MSQSPRQLQEGGKGTEEGVWRPGPWVLAQTHCAGAVFLQCPVKAQGCHHGAPGGVGLM